MIGTTVVFIIIKYLLPMPVKRQYTFDPPDPARMLQGVLMVDVHVKSALKDRNVS